LSDLAEVHKIDLKRQNDDVELDELDQLVELITCVGRLEKPAVRQLLMYSAITPGSLNRTSSTF
jgi:hypothetical protein